MFSEFDESSAKYSEFDRCRRILKNLIRAIRANRPQATSYSRHPTTCAILLSPPAAASCRSPRSAAGVTRLARTTTARTFFRCGIWTQALPGRSPNSQASSSRLSIQKSFSFLGEGGSGSAKDPKVDTTNSVHCAKFTLIK